MYSECSKNSIQGSTILKRIHSQNGLGWGEQLPRVISSRARVRLGREVQIRGATLVPLKHDNPVRDFAHDFKSAVRIARLEAPLYPAHAGPEIKKKPRHELVGRDIVGRRGFGHAIFFC